MTVIKLETRSATSAQRRASATGISKATIASAKRKARETGHDVYLVDKTGPRGTGSLMLRVSSSSELFYLRYMQARSRSWQPVGPYSETAMPGFFTLSEARDVALREAAKRRAPPSGADGGATTAVTLPLSTEPSSVAGSADAVQLPLTSDNAKTPTLSDLCRSYVDKLRRRNARSAENIRSLFKRVYESSLASVPAHLVTAGQVTELLRPIVASGLGTTAENLRRNLRTAYRSVMKERHDATRLASDTFPLVLHNPIDAVKEMGEYIRSRDRELSALELREVVKILRERAKADESVDSLSSRVVLISLYLGGQRAEQLLAAKLSELDLDNPVVATMLLRDGKGRRKEPRRHLLPLEDQVLEMVKWFAARSKELRSPWVFATVNTHLALSGSYLSKLINDISKQVIDEPWCRGPFQYRDLRRTVETLLASIDIDDKSRGHVMSHGLGGVQDKHYNMWDYMLQKRRTLKIWHEMLGRICDDGGPSTPNVSG